MIFKSYDSEVVARIFFNGYFLASLFLGSIALYGFASGAGILSTISGGGYIVIVSLLSLNKRFRRNSFSIPFIFFTFLHLTIPATFILIKGGDYVYGDGLASIPFAQRDYHEFLPLGFLYLSVSWIAIWLGIISADTSRQEINQKNFTSIKLMPILLLGFIVLVVTWIDSQSFNDVRLYGTEKVTSLLAFVFNDNAYLVMVGLVLFFKLNESKCAANSRKITILISIIFAGFTLGRFIDGSKAAILVIFVTLALYPFCFSREYPHARVLFPSVKFLVILVLLSPILFYFALINRMSLGLNVAPTFDSLPAGISEFHAGTIYDIFNQILYRLSWGGIDRFLLIFQSFIMATFNSDITVEFIIYLVKNTFNFLLLGTPFQEAYAPSSQLFSLVIEGQTIDGNIGKIELIRGLNTQPYTMFGIFTIIFGLAAPAFLYFFALTLTFVYNKIRNLIIKISILVFFFLALSSFGIEVAFCSSIHLFVSILIMCFLIKIFSRFHARSAVQSAGSVSA